MIRPLEAFEMAPPDETEAKYRLLGKRFTTPSPSGSGKSPLSDDQHA